MDRARSNPDVSAGSIRAGRSKLLRLAVWTCAGACVSFALGFLLFCSLIMKAPGNTGRADGIVALTGGEARIPEAVKLLMQGNGRRLLISGVNPTTTQQELVNLVPDTKMLFRCCIDVDKVARDTIGNANETRRWMEKRRFRSLSVVTSSYHMPRSMAELRRALPDVELIPYPVVTPRNHLRTWWSHPGSLQLLVSEYMKFLPALVRCVASQVAHGQWPIRSVRQCINGGYTG
jgi:uncharacterized SAM-binding protein YcdF (DUF218 family)